MVHLTRLTRATSARGAAGVSLIELIVVTGMISVVMAISIASFSGFIRDSRADSAMNNALDALRLARERAIGERRNFVVRFIEPNQIQVARVEVPSGDTTVTANTYLEGNMEFLLFAQAGDTPDEFGDADAIAFGSSPTRMFTSEGTFVDSGGDPLNGTIFLGTRGEPTSQRAITLMGATALIHGWRWNGKDWVD